ncbi:MAG: DUF4815 domain-containing protein [Sphaerobacter sp.]|nr:DUF4815 domain-containing protein [Sphaerobacter sp.]
MCLEGSVSVTRGSQPGTVDTATLQAPAPAAIDAVEVSQGGKTFKEGTDFTWQYSGGQLAIDWSPDGAEPSSDGDPNTTDYTVTYVFNCPAPRIAGVEKHTVGTVGSRTSDDTEIVDGYTAIPVGDLGVAGDGGAVLEGQSRWVVPIVQTNNGWNTELVITNVSGKTTSVNATFYAEGGQGFAGPSVAILSGETLAAGESVLVDLKEWGFPEGEVGSVWVDATNAVVAGAFRAKPSTDMMLTTLAQPRTDENDPGATLKYGPLVFRDYNGWNTGINIANLSSSTNQVTVTYYNYAGNAVATETVTIPPRAMEYVYTPASGNFGVGENQITAVRIAGSAPLVAAIDEVKYLGGQGQGHAMSYPAAWALNGWLGDAPTSNADGRYEYDALLALPLVQKGNGGSGDTSGINLFNPDFEYGVNAYIQFVDASGVPVAPTVGNDDSEAPIVLPLAPHAGATVYTLNYSEMPAGFQGAAVIGVEGLGALVGVSNNVNYDVAGDGSAVFNLTNLGVVFDGE